MKMSWSCDKGQSCPLILTFLSSRILFPKLFLAKSMWPKDSLFFFFFFFVMGAFSVSGMCVLGDRVSGRARNQGAGVCSVSLCDRLCVLEESAIWGVGILGVDLHASVRCRT
jgi:hypothetical protein